MLITILGCGGSFGVPSIDSGFFKCNPLNSKNIRLRTSVLIEDGDTTILIDSGPDFRVQAIENKITKLDAILYTHAHGDHIMGINELRSINKLMNKVIPIFLTKNTLKNLKQQFKFAITNNNTELKGFYKPMLDPNIIKYYDIFYIGKTKIQVTKQNHGYSETSGFIINDKLVYATDFISLPLKTMNLYKNKKLIIAAAVQKEKHSCHIDFESVLHLIKDLKIEVGYLTHMGASMDYDEILLETSKLNIFPCYDNLKIEV